MKDKELNYMDAPKPLDAAQKQAMARLWADEGMRSYILHLAQVSNVNAMTCVNQGKEKEGMLYANRFTIYKQLLEVAKNEFINFETKIREIK